MIAYDLQCSEGHAFEGWFEDADAYEAQRKEGLLTCPVCSDGRVARVPSAFAIGRKPAGAESEIDAAAREIGRRMVDFVEKNFHDVGCDFAKEALKIHYGAAEPRNIRGNSTEAEEKTLTEEGVRFFKLPLPARSKPNS